MPRKLKTPFSLRMGRSNNVVICETHVTSPPSKWDQWFLIRSDAHWDNPDSNWDLQLKHLEQAKQRNAGVIDCGDLFCAMQGRWDKRSNKSKMRPEHQTADYLDALVTTGADFHEPYAHLWVAQGSGNHEDSILKKHETCLLTRWAQVLRDRTKAPVLLTGYSGWVRFNFKIGGTQRQSFNLWHIHGYGGGGPVTKDMIQRNRQLAYVDNADIMVTGHTHDSWLTRDMRINLNHMGEVVQRPVYVVKTPTYKDEYRTGKGGWHVSTGKPPKPLGAWWLRFYCDTERSTSKKRNHTRVCFEIREAA